MSQPTPDEMLELLGVCCDGDTAEGLAAARKALDAYERMDHFLDALKKLVLRRGARARELALALTAYRLGEGSKWEAGRCQAFRLGAFREMMYLGGDELTFACIREATSYVDGVAVCGDCAGFLGWGVADDEGEPREEALTDTERNPAARDGAYPFGAEQ